MFEMLYYYLFIAILKSSHLNVLFVDMVENEKIPGIVYLILLIL